ncbi:hypothetical protein LEMA_P029250.1 [Plenodomus lingam JN3]|uniref:Aminoglycoside phosphotransferase domain-containing protein n=1 Tax=Leptosphaeria maculans (strain JN3 / isolate v23.1.3 / race Av1-4-5-6-7-8) TaxID=985895 RepID=E4ZVZ7_LEPMJ|nr:hypothetical protein LEMA_P029250.1 [Plenodomus lingam JN3]CBX95773.1 hypothetical protein LEMA_P029250.1 [Plenodomus lingam JN3]
MSALWTVKSSTNSLRPTGEGVPLSPPACPTKMVLQQQRQARQVRLEVLNKRLKAEEAKARVEKFITRRAQEFTAKIVFLVAELFPNLAMPSSPLVKLIGFGSYNKVFSITIEQPVPHASSGDSLAGAMSRLFRAPSRPLPVEYALRVPKCSLNLSDEARNLARLKVVGARATFPVPKVLAYDHSADNVLGLPYVLQERLHGNDLAHTWEILNSDQKTSLIPQLCKIIEQMANITSPAAGEISLENLTCSSDEAIKITQFPVPNEVAAASDQEAADANNIPSPIQTPLEYLQDHCRRWYNYERAKGLRNRLKIWSQFQVIARSLDRLGFLGDCFHLSHGDFFARNIMVAVKNSTTAEITGILDWDMCVFAPKFVVLTAPYWAWPGLDSCTWSEDNTDDRYSMMLQDAFKDVASPELLRFAMSDECVLANLLWKSLVTGTQIPEQQVEAARLIRDWALIHPEDKDELENCC